MRDHEETVMLNDLEQRFGEGYSVQEVEQRRAMLNIFGFHCCESDPETGGPSCHT